MTKHITLIVENIKRAKDKRFVNEIIDAISDSLTDFPDTVGKINISRDKDLFYTAFDIKVSKLGDLFFVLLTEFLGTICQTEDRVEVTLQVVEEKAINGIQYKLSKFVKP